MSEELDGSPEYESEYSGSDMSSVNEEELYLEQLASAVESKIQEIGKDVDPVLGPLLLKYADALLTKEENNLDPLAKDQNPAEPGNEEEPADDIQVAWEVFEQARLCFEMIEPKTTSVNTQLAFIRQRLADLSSLQGSFDTAIEEYKNAFTILKEVEMKSIGESTTEPGNMKLNRMIAGVLVPLGQALMMLEKFQEAKIAYEEAIERIQREESLADSLPELIESLEECKQQISTSKPVQLPFTKTNGASPEKKQAVFDAPTLENTKPIMIAPIRKKEPQANVPDSERSPAHKKPRV